MGSKEIDPLRNFNVSPQEAIKIQQELREKIKIVPLNKKVNLLGGVDVSMNRFAKHGFAGFVVLRVEDLCMTDHTVVESHIPFPYIPGLLSFREIPMLLLAWEKLDIKPDILLVDGVGIAHPRRMGIATHLGLLLDMPTIGCAKSVLIGAYEEPPNTQGAFSNLYDPKTKEVIGAALRTKVNCQPMFISPGHRITLPEAIEIVLASTKGYRMPEPTRLAHITVNDYRKNALLNLSQK